VLELTRSRTRLHSFFLDGDDSVYPLTVAWPRTKAEYAGKLQFAHDHGFNFVRHHSHTLPKEYFDAADEWGVMISPELPCAYGGFFDAANATGQELYLTSWASYIATLRNHPSILVWTLCNEMYMGAAFKKDGITFGAERFHAVKQALDPARLMNDQDGACGPGDDRDSLSFCSLGFDVFNFGCIGVDTGTFIHHSLILFPAHSLVHPVTRCDRTHRFTHRRELHSW